MDILHHLKKILDLSEEPKPPVLRSLLLLLLILLISNCKQPDPKKEPLKPGEYSPEFTRGQAFIENRNSDSAFYYFNLAAKNNVDSFQKALAYSYMAWLQNDAGDYYGCQESALEGLKLIDEQNPHHHYPLAAIYNELGNSTSAMKNYDDAIRYYDLAVKFSKDEIYIATFRNNLAIAYRDKGDYMNAFIILSSSLESHLPNSIEHARSISNLADLKWRIDTKYNPLPDFRKALEVRLLNKDSMGLTASYKHLSDYYATRKPDSALYYANKLYEVSKAIDSPDDEINGLQRITMLAPVDETRNYLTLLRELKDSIQTARSGSAKQFALIRYETEKNKAENLELLQENDRKEFRITQQRYWIFTIIFVVMVAAYFVHRSNRRRKQKLEWKARETIRENQLKTSQRVHDVVANGLYRIMAELENKNTIDKEQLLDRVEDLYEQSRDISYERQEEITTTAERYNDLLTSFASPHTKVSIVGNEDELWNEINEEGKAELEHVLQELMINMKKHSQAGNVVVRFSLEGRDLEVYYKDDRVGFPEKFERGNGLRSTGNRINKIGGRIIFESPEKGVSIRIIVPIK